MAVPLVQPPLAVHELALLEDHVNVELPPPAMLVGLALTVTTGVATTVTVAEPLPDPPVPVQVIANVLVAAIELTSWLPLVAVLEVQPPVAAHEVAVVDDHVRLEEPPLAMLVGLALTVTVGGGMTVTVADAFADPPTPLQVIE